jgi:hypothetical protein
MRLGLFRCIDLSGNLLTDSSVQALSVLLAALPPAEYVRSAGSPLVVDFSSNEVLRVVYISTYLFNYLSSYLYISIYLSIYLSNIYMYIIIINRYTDKYVDMNNKGYIYAASLYIIIL